jgi:hypothetical protein
VASTIRTLAPVNSERPICVALVAPTRASYVRPSRARNGNGKREQRTGKVKSGENQKSLNFELVGLVQPGLALKASNSQARHVTGSLASARVGTLAPAIPHRCRGSAGPSGRVLARARIALFRDGDCWLGTIGSPGKRNCLAVATAPIGLRRSPPIGSEIACTIRLWSDRAGSSSASGKAPLRQIPRASQY